MLERFHLIMLNGFVVYSDFVYKVTIRFTVYPDPDWVPLHPLHGHKGSLIIIKTYCYKQISKNNSDKNTTFCLTL